MDFHGFEGFPWIPWNSIASMEFHGVHGIPLSQWISMESLDFRKQALKIAENREKHCFTFFAFLPPYVGVSGSLLYAKR